MKWTVAALAAGCTADARPPCEAVDLAADEAVDGVTPGAVTERLAEVSDRVAELVTVANEGFAGGVTFDVHGATQEVGASCNPGFQVHADVRFAAADGTIDLSGSTALEVDASDPWVAVLSLEGDDEGTNDLGQVSLTGTIEPDAASGELHLAQHGALIVRWSVVEPE